MPEDTGLKCPACGYNLTGLTSPKYPECGQQFIIAVPGKREPPPKSMTFTTTSMICPQCQFHNQQFMPKACAECGYRFTLRQRIFGVDGKIG